MSEVQNRIIATEMEYGVTAYDPLVEQLQLVTTPLLQQHVRPALDNLGIPYLSSTPGGTDYFLGNGARLYPDVGFQEYAASEDSTLQGALANEIAGERTIAAIADRYAQETETNVFVWKRVVDEDGQTWGYHANYHVEKENFYINRKNLALFGVFAATRGVLFGAGALRRSGKFAIAQKALGMGSELRIRQLIRNLS
jgi:hypothetical protein